MIFQLTFRYIRVLDGPDVRDQQGISAYFVQMGQFIDHDITLSPEIEDVVCVIFKYAIAFLQMIMSVRPTHFIQI